MRCYELRDCSSGNECRLAPVSTQPATAGAAEHRKLTDAAQQFEGMLLQEMLKPMKEHGFCQEEGDEGDWQGGGQRLWRHAEQLRHRGRGDGDCEGRGAGDCQAGGGSRWSAKASHALQELLQRGNRKRDCSSKINCDMVLKCRDRTDADELNGRLEVSG